MQCGVMLPLDAFSAQKTGALGRNSKCKECIQAIGKAYTLRTREAKADRPRPTHCECCHEPNTARRALHWDHDHKTGEFRGWLCHYCNSVLGLVDDDIPQLQQLIAYLQRGGGPG